ncbi:MAG TPA: glutathione S-transferase [Polyangiales bacterium]|jgi:glutathione S-transferase|nr:glutathione S-transferase [Polyangiales bacterium]
MTAKLYCFGESGNAYKAALTLTLAGYPWEPVFVDFFNGATRTPEYRKLNVMGEVPMFVEGEQVLCQSGVIQYEIVNKTGKLGGDNEQDKREIMRWVLWDNHKMSSQCGTARFLMNFIPAEKRSADVIQYLQGRLQAAFKVLDAHLQGREWIVGKSLSIADTACCGYLYYPEPFGFDRTQWPNISAWLDRISALPGWKHPYDMMPRKAAT